MPESFTDDRWRHMEEENVNPLVNLERFFRSLIMEKRLELGLDLWSGRPLTPQEIGEYLAR